MTPDDQRPWHCGPPLNRHAYRVDDLTEQQGGQGSVFRAVRSTFPGDPVGYEGPAAIKLQLGLDSAQIAKLTERCERLAATRHPSLAPVLEPFVGPGLFRGDTPPTDDAQVFYTATEWIDGDSLRQRAPMEPAAAFAMANDLAHGLHALHANGLVHRDLHPGNVIVRPDGRAVLIDFGSARPDDGQHTMTVTGAHGFIPPEALHRAGDRRSDGWQLAMCVVFALLGHPRGSTDGAVIERELNVALADIADRRGALATLLAMLDDDPDRRPTDLVAWAERLQRSLHASRPRRRRVAVIAGAAAVLVAAGVAIGLVATSDDSSADEASASAAAGAEGQAGKETFADAGLGGELVRSATSLPSRDGCPGDASFATGLDDDLRAAVAEQPDGTCIADVEPFEAATVVKLDRDGSWAGVIVDSPETEPVWLPNAVWASYKEIAGRTTPENAARVGGYPKELEYVRDPDGVVVHLSGGGIITGPREDTQIFWIPPQVLGVWNEHGGRDGTLGFPTSNPYIGADGLRQDYTYGYLRTNTEDVDAAAAGTVPIEVNIADDAAAQLRELGDVSGRIVGQPTVTSWYVDDEGVRHWIPDGDTWVCLGGQANVVSGSVPGYVVAVLPLGPPATCPRK